MDRPQRTPQEATTLAAIIVASLEHWLEAREHNYRDGGEQKDLTRNALIKALSDSLIG